MGILINKLTSINLLLLEKHFLNGWKVFSFWHARFWLTAMTCSSYIRRIWCKADKTNRDAAVPVPPEETWQIACSAPNLQDTPSPLPAAANPLGLKDTHRKWMKAQEDANICCYAANLLTECAWSVASDGASGGAEPRRRWVQRRAEVAVLRKELRDPVCFYCWNTWQEKCSQMMLWDKRCSLWTVSIQAETINQINPDESIIKII